MKGVDLAEVIRVLSKELRCQNRKNRRGGEDIRYRGDGWVSI